MPHNDITLTVIIPAYNEADYLPRYLPTVLAALRHWEAENSDSAGEVIVVDNNSTDDTGPVARDLGARVVTGPVRNIGAARNVGAAAANGHYILRLLGRIGVGCPTRDRMRKRSRRPDLVSTSAVDFFA